MEQDIPKKDFFLEMILSKICNYDQPLDFWTCVDVRGSDWIGYVWLVLKFTMQVTYTISSQVKGPDIFLNYICQHLTVCFFNHLHASTAYMCIGHFLLSNPDLSASG